MIMELTPLQICCMSSKTPFDRDRITSLDDFNDAISNQEKEWYSR